MPKYAAPLEPDHDAVHIRFSIPGAPVSGNHANKSGRFGHYKTREAKDYAERVQSIVRVNAHLVGWRPPEYCRVDMRIWNSRVDRDNVMKELNDALEGTAYRFDSRVLDGWTQRRWDAGGPRVDVWVYPVDAALYGRRR